MRALACGLFILTLAAAANADDRATKATEVFQRAAAAYAKGDFVVAAKAFEEANAILPAGAALYNAGLAWDSAHEDLKAAVDFASALDMGLVSAAQLEDARTRLAKLDGRLGAIDVKAAGRIEIDGAAVEAGHVRLVPGDHRVRAQFEDGTSAEKTVTLAAGASISVELVPPPKEAPPPPPPPEKEPPNVLRIAGLALGGVAIAGVGVGIGVGVAGMSARDDFVSQGRTDQGLREKAVTLQTAANVAFIASAILGAAGIGFLTWSFVRKPHAESAVYAVPGGVAGMF